MAVILLLVIMTVSTVMVRMGAFALELTGMPWEQAKFQALSAFTNSGFTTREAEQITQHPVRRRIVSYLIVIGNAGIVTSIGSFGVSLTQGTLIGNLRNLGYILAGVLVLYLLSRWEGFMSRMRVTMEGWLSRRWDFQPPRAEELLRLDEGYGLTRVELSEASPVAGKALGELDLKSWMVQIIAIERGNEFKPIPTGKDRLLPGDALVVYGAEDAILKVFRPKRTKRLTIMGDANPAMTQS